VCSKTTRHIVCIGMILLVGFVTLSWSGGDYFVKSLDCYFDLNPDGALQQNQYIWKSWSSVGHPWPDVNQLPFAYFWWFLAKLGLTLVMAQKVVLYLLFTLSMLSMYFLLNTVFPGHYSIYPGIARVLASILYVMNPFTMSFIWWHQMLWEFVWPAYPLILALLIRFLNVKGIFSMSWQLTVLGVVLLIFAPGINGISGSLIVVTIIAYVIWRALFGRPLRIIGKGLLFLLIAVGLTLWYMVPIMTSLETEYRKGNVGSDAGAETYFLSASRYTTVLNTLRLMGTKTLYVTYRDESYYRWAIRRN